MRLQLALAFLALVPSVSAGGIKKEMAQDFERIDDAAAIFAIAEANSAVYGLNQLRGSSASPLGPNLGIFEKYFPKLSAAEQLKLTLLILAHYDFEGEYSFRFRMMIRPYRERIAAGFWAINRDDL
jgi:hypothetical protein